MTSDPVAAWVSRVNRLADEIDATAASLHPSAWPEALAPDFERFCRLAASGPANDRRPGVSALLQPTLNFP